jgi:acyl-CoA hydrolase
MEVFIEVTAEDIPASKKIMTHRAFFTFVAVDQNGKPIEIPQIVPETAEEIELFEGALRRRQLRLVLAQRMKPEDAVELRAIFNLDKK